MRKIASSYGEFLKVLGGFVVAILVVSVNWGLDWDLYDFLHAFKGKRAPNPEIILISVDDKTFKETGKLWPLPLSFYQKMIEKVCSESPKVVGFDIEFSYAEGSKEEYRKMASAIADMGCITLWGRDFIENEVILKPVPAELPFANWTILNEFKREGRSPKKHMQYVRRVTPYWYNGQDLIETLAFKAAQIYLGKNLVRDKKDWYEFLIDYAGPGGTYKVISLIDVLNDKIPDGFFRGKIVLVGRGESEYYTNYVRTPYFSGKRADTLRLEVHANVADTIIMGKEIRIANKHFAYVLTFALSVVTVFILFGTTPLIGIATVLGTFALLLIIGIISLKAHYYISVVPPLLGVFISYYLLIPYRLVSEYRKRWEFQQANRILSEVERMKSNFLSLITHDLKTPIARIQGLAETMLSEYSALIQGKASKPLKAIIKNSEELNNFISRILDLSQVEASQVKLNITSRDINSLIDEICERFKYIMKDKELVLEKKLEPLFSIKMDENLIGQVIYNLMDNAVKYSRTGGAINIRSWEEADFVKVSISDEGIGIKEEDQKGLFTKFFRGKDARGSEIKGSGLGLYLVKYFVELHGGKISARSEYGKGSTFTFSLPVK